jgi:hypothetical protein
MKKILTLLTAVVLLFADSHAQAPKTMLYEQSTSGQCVNCPYANQLIEPLLLANYKKLVAIKYQSSQPGGDVMYFQDPFEVDARQRFYDAFEAPYAVVQGDTNILRNAPNYWGFPGGVTNTMVDTIDLQTTPISMRATYAYDAAADSIHATVIVKNVSSSAFTSSGPGTLRLMFALQEMQIHFSAPPGSNGETDFYYVFRKFYPDTLGTVMPNSLPAGDSLVYTFSIQPPSYIFNKTEMGIAAWVQDFGTSMVHQAVKAPIYDSLTDVALADSTLYPAAGFACNQSFVPTVRLTNKERTVINSALLSYYYLGSNLPPHTYQWTGSLDSGQSTIITFPATSIADNTYDSIYYAVSDLNGGDLLDTNLANNYPVSPLLMAISATAVSDTLTEGFDEMSDALIGSISTPTSLFYNGGHGQAFIADQNYLRAFLADPNTYQGSMTVSDSSARCGGYGLSDASYCFMIGTNFYVATAALIFDGADRTGYTSGDLTFQHAYTTGDTFFHNIPDTLTVLVSTDCGQTWSTVWMRSSTQLMTAPQIIFREFFGKLFIPTSTQWATDTVDMSAYNGMNNVIVKFQVTYNQGNALYLDNINWTGINPLGIKNVSAISAKVYPNPATSMLNVQIGNNTSGCAIELYDLTGQCVMHEALWGSTTSFSIASLTDGMYLYRVVDGKNSAIANGKVTIEK